MMCSQAISLYILSPFIVFDIELQWLNSTHTTQFLQGPIFVITKPTHIYWGLALGSEYLKTKIFKTKK